ncbi:peroxisomal coenzyme A diphosphatase NUDT7, partial [Tremellales sp. Uapishka_1]
MRSYAADTALPGGKYEVGDADEEATARREAYEEIGLPTDPPLVRTLTLLPPFLSGNALLVTPVVLLVLDNSIPPLLNPSEVTSLFSMPLAAFLHSRPSRIPNWDYGPSSRVSTLPAHIPPPPTVGYGSDAGEVGGKEGRYYGFRDIGWGGGRVRMHRFLTGREGEGVKPVYGLTAAILIQVAMVGYGQRPAFEIYADGQKSMVQRIEDEARKETGALRRAIEDECLWDEWKKDLGKL